MTAQLASTRKALEDMSPEELRQHILRLREERKMFKVDPVVRKQKSKTHQDNKKKAAQILQDMSPEDKAALLAQYMKGK